MVELFNRSRDSTPPVVGTREGQGACAYVGSGCAVGSVLGDCAGVISLCSFSSAVTGANGPPSLRQGGAAFLGLCVDRRSGRALRMVNEAYGYQDR